MRSGYVHIVLTHHKGETMNPFHLLAYSESVGQVTNEDIAAPNDEVIQVRNGHPIYSEDYNMIAAYPIGAALSRMRFGNVSLTYRGVQHFWPLSVGAAPQRLPQVSMYYPNPIRLPRDEEVTVEATTTAVGPQIVSLAKFIALPDWSPIEPMGEEMGWIRATVVIVAGAASAWTAPVAITLERDLYAGVYAVVGAHVVAANALFFRMIFRTSPKVNGRQHRPGGIVMDTAALEPWDKQGYGLGEWGRFATFELPSIQTFDDAAGGTYEVRLRLRYLGNDRSLLYAR